MGLRRKRPYIVCEEFINSLKIKIYITDEGYGPIIRQNAIINEVKNINEKVQFTLQSQSHFKDIKRIIPGQTYINKFNNIIWHRQSNGSPDIKKINSFFDDYKKRSESFINDEINNVSCDLIITDFVAEAFQISKETGIPAIGVCHFTWDWFFLKLLKKNHPFFKLIESYMEHSNVIYFPPFTPIGVVNKYADKAKNIPFIFNKNKKNKTLSNDKKFKILVMDSGGNVISSRIEKIIDLIRKNSKYHFYISDKFNVHNDHVSFIRKHELFSSYIPKMDLVIGRGGFNTFTECLANRVPFLMLNEKLNPEMEENSKYYLETNLCKEISLDGSQGNFMEVLDDFIKFDYKKLKFNMQNHNFKFNGAKVIAEDIISKYNV